MARYPHDHPESGGGSGDPPRRVRWTTLLWVLVSIGAVVGALVAASHAIKPAQRPAFADPAPATTGGPPADGGPPSGTAATVPSPRPPVAAPQLTLAFAGDVHFAGRVGVRLDQPASVLGPVTTVLSRADLAMVNLETAITERGTPEPKEFQFRAPPAAFTALRSAGVDIATMANNHGVDYGPVGLRDSLAAITAARFPVVGIGRNAVAAYAPWVGTIRGHRVAVLAASQIRDRTLSAWTAGDASPGIASAYSDRLVTAVRAARRVAEIVVVYLHWGVEGAACPSGEQRRLASALSLAGADAVLGTHAHLLQGAGWLGDTYVAYGLGNFLWWRDNAFSNDTGVLTVTFRGRRAIASTFTPARIDDEGVPIPAVNAARTRILAGWDQARGCTGLTAAPATPIR